MWNYSEINAYNSISLHDCRSDSITINGNDLIFDFPDGFWLTPVSTHIDNDTPIKTGPAQLCIHGAFNGTPFDTIDVYKTVHIFGKPILCRRLQPDFSDFLKTFKHEKYELEFITDYHSSMSSLYQCWIWKKDFGMVAECQFELISNTVEYRWNDIRYDREW